MKSKVVKFLIITLVILFLAYVLGSQAPLPPQVKQALHDVNILKIEKQAQTAEIWELPNNPDLANIIELDIDRCFMSSAQVEVLKNWIREGQTLWLVKPELHPKLMDVFGFSTSHYNTDIKHIIAKSASGHPVLTDVEKIQLTSSYYDHWRSFKSGYDVPLLFWEEKSKPMAVLKYLDSGSIIAMAAFSHGKYDGNRFYTNLKEFSAGYPVPPSVISGEVFTEPAEKYDRIVLTNQDIISGTVLKQSFTIKTSYGIFSFEKEKISWIDFGADIHKLVLRTGDQLMGIIQEQELKVKTVAGEVKTISTEKVKRMSFATSTD